MGRAKDLLIELLGEEVYEGYRKGDAIKVEAPNDITYIIERRGGYADIVRIRKMRRYSNTIGIDGNMASYETESRDSGRLRAFNIDDGVATFIEHARLGKVNWACGNIDIDLPKNMPPRNTNFVTFFMRGVKTIAYYLWIFPSWYIEQMKNGDTVGTFMFGIMLPWFITLITWAFTDWNAPMIIGIPILFFPVYMGIFMGYGRWKKEWEVKLA